MNPIDSPDSEPSIGATAAIDQSDWGGFVHHGEQDCELDTADEEPSLGAPNPSATTGCNWLRGPCYGDDREDDPSELEPSIGARRRAF